MVTIVQKPKMVLFDYGHTLLYEPGFDGLRGTKAVLKYATQNKNDLTAEEVNQFSSELFSTISKLVRSNGIEMHNHMFQKMLYEYLQIEIPLSPNEMEQICWDNAAPGEAMPNIKKVLDYLKEHKIRSGVISNIAYGGETLKNRLDRVLPNNSFEFVIASSEYMICKPNPMIFELALRKANLSAEEVWYCGDNTECDIYGASGAGIFPVWYHSPLECTYREKSLDVKPDCEHLYINDWLELIDALENTKE